MTEVLEFDVSTLQAATNNYSTSNLLAKGGYGSVYKGFLRGSFVAIKRLTTVSRLYSTCIEQ